MNPIKINDHFALPEGMAVEKRRQRTTALLGLSLALIVPLPAGPVEAGSLRGFFIENAQGLRDVMFKVNEVVPFDVDRAIEYGYAVWARRYENAFNPNPHLLFGSAAYGGSLNEVIPELTDLSIGAEPIASTVAFLKECTSA